MADIALFTFAHPLVQDQLSTLAEQVINTRTSNDPQKAYFLSSLVYLLRFARDNLNSRQNVTLGIAQPTEEKNSDELWRKDRVWVKVKMTGGSAPRVNFMATSYGVAQVNWKANTRIFLGAIPIHSNFEVLEKYPTGTLFTGFTDPKEPSALFSRSHSTDRYGHAASSFGEIVMMNFKDVSDLVNDPARLEQVATNLFQIFDEDKSNSIDQKEFIKFFSQFLHQPIEETLQFFNQVSSGTGKISKDDFKIVFVIFLNNWLMEEKMKRVVFFWNCFVSIVAEMPARNRGLFRKDTTTHREVIEGLLMSLEMPLNVQWKLYLHLHQNFDQAMYRPNTPETKIREKFNAIAQHGVITIEQYMKEFEAGLDEILAFLTDWDACHQIYYRETRRTREEAIAWVSSPEGPKAILTQIFTYFQAKDRLDFPLLVRYNRCSSIPISMNISELEQEVTGLSFQDATDGLLAMYKKSVLDDIEHPGRSSFIELAGKKPAELLTITIEKFRLQEIAHDLFASVYPVRDRHDFETFQLYANCMCEVFQVENAQETVATIFDHFNTDGFITESDFAMCLKQMIGYQLKWAKSREIQENAKKEGIRELMQNPDAWINFVTNLFNAADSNHDGSIDRSEFKQAMMVFVDDNENPFKKTDEEVNIVFDKLDTNHDGELSLDEYQVFITECVLKFLNS